jgi:putative transposase
MRRDLRSHIAHCHKCLQSKHEHHARTFSRSMPFSSRPYAIVQVDLLTGLPTSSEGHNAILALVDTATRMAHFFACTKSATTKHVADILFNEVCIARGAGAFDTIQSDRGSQFTSSLYRNLMQHWGTTVSLSSVATPTGQSLVEASNNFISSYLRRVVNEGGANWHTFMDIASFAHNSTTNSVTNCTPFELLQGFKPRTPVEIGLEHNLPLGNPEDTDERLKRLAQLRQIAIDIRADNADETALREGRIVTPMSLKPNDLVFVHRSILLPTHLRHEAGSKLDPLYYGPIRVMSTPSPNTAELDFPTSFRGHRIVNTHFLRPLPNDPDFARSQPLREHQTIDGHIAFLVDKILKHKKDTNGSYSFYVHWRDFPASARSWEPIDMFSQEGRITNTILRKYIQRQELPINMEAV